MVAASQLKTPIGQPRAFKRPSKSGTMQAMWAWVLPSDGRLRKGNAFGSETSSRKGYSYGNLFDPKSVAGNGLRREVPITIRFP